VQAWSASEQPGGQTHFTVQVDSKAEDKQTKEEVKAGVTPAKEDALAVVVPTKEEVKAPVAPTTKSLLGDAYPDLMSIASTALDTWTKGKTQVNTTLHMCRYPTDVQPLCLLCL